MRMTLTVLIAQGKEKTGLSACQPRSAARQLPQRDRQVDLLLDPGGQALVQLGLPQLLKSGDFVKGSSLIAATTFLLLRLSQARRLPGRLIAFWIQFLLLLGIGRKTRAELIKAWRLGNPSCDSEITSALF
jgi:hypothetical protein